MEKKKKKALSDIPFKLTDNDVAEKVKKFRETIALNGKYMI